MVYYYNLPVYFSLYHVLKRTFLAIIFQSHFAYFALVILTYVTYDRNQGKLKGGLCSFQGKSMKNMIAFAHLTCIAS